MKAGAAYIAWRFYGVILCLLLAVTGVTLRIFELSVVNQHFLRHEGNIRVLRVFNSPATRGMITDRSGYPLAISTKVDNVALNPQKFAAADSAAKNLLCSILHLKLSLLEHDLEKAKNRSFIYLKRGLDPVAAEKLYKAHLPGVILQETYKRYYPEGEITSHLIGFTNVDDQGQEGLELAYNKSLTGVAGKELVTKDRLGRIIEHDKLLQQALPSQKLVLSIDKRIQFLAYRELMQGAKKNLAESATAIVLDAHNGEILAMVNYPSYNPNQRRLQSSSVYRNRAVTDLFEPGSTIKSFSIATALASGHYKATSLIDTSPGWLRVGHYLVRDEHNNKVLTVAQILQLSSNIGIAKLLWSLPANGLWDLLHQAEFGQRTALNFPGEQAGSLVPHQKWAPIVLATLGYGYGISVTPIQLVHAYAIFANQGVKLPVTLLKSEHVPQGERIMPAEVAQAVLAMLETVTTSKGATGELARIPGYRVAGKTGTAVIAGPHGYLKKHYVSTFIGIAPVTHPRFVVAVILHDPRNKAYYGGTVAAPIFAKIMEGSLRLMHIRPDDVAGLVANNIMVKG